MSSTRLKKMHSIKSCDTNRDQERALFAVNCGVLACLYSGVAHVTLLEVFAQHGTVLSMYMMDAIEQNLHRRL